ncbi:MAG: hypothetical protein Q7W30_01615 [Coriobacteriia bacterium]|nr:hypothetical protein [Coriobacteriia bacterium]
MSRAGFCSECNANVWVGDDGTCPNGHAPGSVSGIYETAGSAPLPQPTPLAASPAPKKSMAWIVVAVIAAVLGLCGCGAVGLFATTGASYFSSAKSEALQKACFANQRMVEGAVEMYLASGPEALRTDVAGPLEAGSPLISSTYLREVPRCALGDKPYVYDAEKQQANCPYGDAPEGHGHYEP